MAEKTIAYLTPLYFSEESCLGGGERYPLNMARGVVESTSGRFEVELISYGDRPHRQPLAEGVWLRVLTAAGRPRNPLDVVSWELPDALAGADLLHIHQAYTRCAELGLLVARQLRRPICVTDHGGESSDLGRNLGSLELADRVVAYSDFGASLYRTQTPIEVVKGGVDAGRFTPAPEPVARDRILYLGRLLPHKGIDRLIAAMPADIPLTVCGRAYSAEYYGLLRERAEGKCVEFITDADDDRLLDLYRRSWAVVLPSVHIDCYGRHHRAPELMGLSLLEGMACGTPGLCPRVAAMPEFVAQGETGFVYDTLEELTAAIRRLAGDPALVERLGAQARAAVEREYDYRVAGGRLAAIYDQLIDRSWEAAA